MRAAVMVAWTPRDGARPTITAMSSNIILRAADNVQRRIADAIHRIQEHDAALAQHLSRAVRTGAYLSYLPERARR